MAVPLRNRLKALLSLVLPYRPMAGGRERLEAEYARGKWDYLAGIEELGRFSVLVGYCHFLKERPRVLEIGSGEGLLAERLCSTRIEAYVGVDISGEAVERARARSIDWARFHRSEAETWMPEGEFDLILFTECLEYFEDPLGVVRRYESFLTGNGLLLASIFTGVDTRRSERIWRMLETRYVRLDETRVTNRVGLSWIVRVLQPPSGSG